MAALLPAALEVVGRSFLSKRLQTCYRELLEKHTASLKG